MKTSYRAIKVSTLLQSGSVTIRPLSIIEINNSLLLARKSGWYGNSDLSKYLLQTCISRKDSDINYDSLDMFFIFQIVRAIWTATLKALSAYVNNLLDLVGLDTVQKIKIKPYSFSDLITPGLLMLVQRDSRNINVAKYSEDVISHIIHKIKIGNELYTEKEKSRFLEDKFDEICRFILNKNGIDIDLNSDIFNAFYVSEKEKFYAALKVAETVDWIQYYKILFCFNTIVENLNLASNRLGGISSDKAVLITGMPSFIDMLRFPKSIPIQVIASLSNDIIAKNLYTFSSYYKAKLRKLLYDSIREIPKEVLDRNNKGEIIISTLNNFALKLNSRRRLLTIIYNVYVSELSKAFTEYMKKFVEKYTEEIKNTVPDCYLLVEGITDFLIFNHIVGIINDSEASIRVINCRGKNGVLNKYRDIIENESYIGAVITVLDSDADSEHKKILKLKYSDLLVSNYIFESGALEDQFNVKQHLAAIKELYPNGEKISLKDFYGNHSMTAKLRKIIWKKKKTDFDKVEYTHSLLRQINSKESVPAFIKKVVKKAIEYGMICFEKHPTKQSVRSIDRLTRNMDMKIVRNKRLH